MIRPPSSATAEHPASLVGNSFESWQRRHSRSRQTQHPSDCFESPRQSSAASVATNQHCIPTGDDDVGQQRNTWEQAQPPVHHLQQQRRHQQWAYPLRSLPAAHRAKLVTGHSSIGDELATVEPSDEDVWIPRLVTERRQQSTMAAAAARLKHSESDRCRERRARTCASHTRHNHTLTHSGVVRL